MLQWRLGGADFNSDLVSDCDDVSSLTQGFSPADLMDAAKKIKHKQKIGEISTR